MRNFKKRKRGRSCNGPHPWPTRRVTIPRLATGILRVGRALGGNAHRDECKTPVKASGDQRDRVRLVDQLAAVRSSGSGTFLLGKDAHEIGGRDDPVQLFAIVHHQDAVDIVAQHRLGDLR